MTSTKIQTFRLFCEMFSISSFRAFLTKSISNFVIHVIMFLHGLFDGSIPLISNLFALNQINTITKADTLPLTVFNT